MYICIVETNINNMTIIKETEKAIQVNVILDVDYAPCGGFTSSMVKNRTITTTAWFAKSIIKDGVVPEYFVKKKSEEIAEKFCPCNGKVIYSKLHIVCK